MQIAAQPCSVAVGHAGRVRCERDWRLTADWARTLVDDDLWFVWAGRGRMRTGAGEVALSPGTCIWLRPGGHYEAEQDKTARLGVNYIHFQLLKPADGLPLSGFARPFEVCHTRQLGFVDTVMQRVIGLRTEPAGAPGAAALFGALLMELVREHGTRPAPSAPGIDQHHHDIVLRAAAQIREDPGRVPPIAVLARRAGYSVDHFSRMFLRITGARPQDYVINARLARARQLLAESDFTISQVAEALGFQNIYYFSRLFRQRTGQTPTDFRRSLRQT